MAAARIEIASENGCLEAFVACPDVGAHPPILLLGSHEAPASRVAQLARRLSARRYYVMAPEWSARPASERREDAEAWFDHLADEPRSDDARVAILGFGAGADVALQLAAWHAERVAAVAAFGGQGLGPAAAADVAQRLNAVIRVGYPIGRPVGRAGVLETAFALAGVDFEIEIYEDEPDWAELLDLLERTMPSPRESETASLAPSCSTDGRPI